MITITTTTKEEAWAMIIVMRQPQVRTAEYGIYLLGRKMQNLEDLPEEAG